MPDSGVDWQTGAEGLILGTAVVSFQRYLYSAELIISEAPRSCGVLPVAPGRGGLLLAVPDGEAFWIGVLRGPGWDGELAVSVELIDHTVVSLARFDQPGANSIDGIPRSDGRFDVLCRETVRRVIVGDVAAVVGVDLVDVEGFVAQTGHRPPAAFDPNSAYGGWRLP